MSKRLTSNKDILYLSQLAVDQGWRVERSPGGHLKWYGPDGGFFTTAATPSDVRIIHNIRAELRRRGWKDPARRYTPEEEVVTPTTSEPTAPDWTQAAWCQEEDPFYLPITIFANIIRDVIETPNTEPPTKETPTMTDLSTTTTGAPTNGSSSNPSLKYTIGQIPDPPRPTVGRPPIWHELLDDLYTNHPDEWACLEGRRSTGTASTIKKAAKRWAEARGVTATVQVATRRNEAISPPPSAKDGAITRIGDIWVRVTPVTPETPVGDSSGVVAQ